MLKCEIFFGQHCNPSFPDQTSKIAVVGYKYRGHKKGCNEMLNESDLLTQNAKIALDPHQQQDLNSNCNKQKVVKQ
jgi:hypothetical protein